MRGQKWWEITYYGYGMTPQTEKFDDELEALNTWEAWSRDPHKGATRLAKVEVIYEA